MSKTIIASTNLSPARSAQFGFSDSTVDLESINVSKRAPDDGARISFDGIAGYASGDDDDLPWGASNRTLMMRIFMPNPVGGSAQEFVSYGNGSGHFFGAYVNTSPAGVVTSQNAGAGFSTSNVVDDGEWHTFFLKTESGTWSSYIDGNGENSSGQTLDTTSSGTIKIGSSDAPWEGYIDMVAFWARALSDVEIEALAADPFLGVG